jgi:photosystem II stability/assembly factor-like uncharacterized protein
MEVAVYDGLEEAGSCIFKDLGSDYTTIYARVYVLLDGMPQVNSIVEVFGFSTYGWLPDASGTRIDIVNDNGALEWRLNYYDDGWQSADGGSIGLNTWYCVEVELSIGSGTGETRLYVDGAELIAKTGLSNEDFADYVRYFSLGIDDELGKIDGNTFNAYFDSVAMADEYIGPLPESNPTPSPTPTESPAPSAAPTATPIPTSSPTLTPTPIVTSTPTPSANPTTKPNPTPSPTPLPSPSPTTTQAPTQTPTPTATPTPASSPIYRESSVTKPIQASWIASDGTLYAGVGDTLYKSLDQGITWQSLKTFSGTSAGINCVFVSSSGYVFVVPDTNTDASLLGIWRSIDGGATWNRVLPMPSGCTVLSVMTEDTNGNLFVGIYTVGNVGNASICKSTDGGEHWSRVYYDSAARHVHYITVDKANNFIYASVGDQRIFPWYTSHVVRSTDGGASWTNILTLPQIIAIEAIDRVDANGNLVPIARLFATDYDNGQIYRTVDDANFNLVFDDGVQCYGFWMRTNSLNGQIYASFVGGENPSKWDAGIWISSDNGVSWSLYDSFPIHYAYYGSTAASNFYQGTMYYDLQLNNGWQNGIRIYPDYSISKKADFTSLGNLQSAMLIICVTAISVMARAIQNIKLKLNNKIEWKRLP